MTPEEKAKDLIDKFEDENLHFIKDILESAKHYSLLCVDEIIKSCEYNNVETYNTDWWNKVKEEIRKIE